MTALRAGVTRGRLCARRQAVLRRIVLRPMHEGIVDRIGHSTAPIGTVPLVSFLAAVIKSGGWR
ncbi:hypothetical protein FHT09_001263 [Xanthomonas arboricola]|uniref:hypothetical protein n=1 Tax=Xanthomonas TaxID=338 RepID=UPI0015E443CE|nr:MULTISPECIES: hypothetical protein [Xanthomonas]MBB5735564.1 hypothetical protein [Xanthomonas sp. CFBP 8152]